MAISPAPTSRLPLIRLSLLVSSVGLMGLSLVWGYLGMRAIMDIGGTCATGGPYVSAQECPTGASALLAAGLPLLVLATFAASGVAMTLSAPTLLLPMWILLFGSFGWNFLEYAFAGDGIVIGWLVCGIAFMAMAVPALVVLIGARRVQGLVTRNPGREARWWLTYAVAGGVGAWLGLWSYAAWA